MSPGPKLDPNWVRRRQQNKSDHSIPLALRVSALLICRAAYLWRAGADREAALTSAKETGAAIALTPERA
jgi:hypothetical protein